MLQKKYNPNKGQSLYLNNDIIRAGMNGQAPPEEAKSATTSPLRLRLIADDIFKRIFFNENVWISIEISLKFVTRGPINNIPALV